MTDDKEGTANRLVPDVKNSKPACCQYSDLLGNCLSLLYQQRIASAQTYDCRLATKALRRFYVLRKRVDGSVLERYIRKYVADDDDRQMWLGSLRCCLSDEQDEKTQEGKPTDKTLVEMEIDAEETQEKPIDVTDTGSMRVLVPIPEYRLWLQTLVLVAILDTVTGRLRRKPSCSYEEGIERALEVAQSLSAMTMKNLTRPLDPLCAKALFYYGRVYELADKNAEARPLLLDAYRVGILHQLPAVQGTTINIVLRSFIKENLIEEATKFAFMTNFPELYRSINQFARYLFYIGYIQAMRLNYQDALSKLVQAIRKAPQGSIGLSFRERCHQFAVVVELLTGSIPSRTLFNQKDLCGLAPYRELVLSVHRGDVNSFELLLQQRESKFKSHGTLALVRRLRQSVLCAGLKRISKAYSRISLQVVAQRLGMETWEDAEAMVSQAIADNIINGTIDLNDKTFVCKFTSDMYSTHAPTIQLRKRINVCQQLHNEAVRSMQYPSAEDDVDAKTKEAEQARHEEEERMHLVEGNGFFDFEDF